MTVGEVLAFNIRGGVLRNYIRSKIRSYVSGIVKQCVDEALGDDKWGRVAGCISPQEIAQYVDMDEIKDYCAEAVDLQEIAECFGVSDIASEIDISDIACEIAVDATEVADNLDYRMLAMELLACAKAEGSGGR